MTEARISGARDYRRAISDILLQVSVVAKPQKAGKHSVQVDVTVNASHVDFTAQDGRHVASIEIALFVGARSQRQIGQMRRTIDLKLTPANYEALQRDGFAFSAEVEASDEPRYVKAIVYDYTADRIGSAFGEVNQGTR